MAVPKIETFEGQITEEIKDKEDVMADLVASSGKAVIGRERKNFTYLILGAIVFLLTAFIVGAVYFYLKDDTIKVDAPISEPNSDLPSSPEASSPNKLPGAEVSIYSLLPQTSISIGRFVESGAKTDEGYVFTIKEYEPVVAYLMQNELTLGNEALSLFGGTASGTIIFRDITRANQDIRVYDASSPGVAYAFFGTTTLLLAPDEEKILKMRNVIIK